MAATIPATPAAGTVHLQGPVEVIADFNEGETRSELIRRRCRKFADGLTVNRLLRLIQLIIAPVSFACCVVVIANTNPYACWHAFPQAITVVRSIAEVCVFHHFTDLNAVICVQSVFESIGMDLLIGAYYLAITGATVDLLYIQYRALYQKPAMYYPYHRDYSIGWPISAAVFAATLCFTHACSVVSYALANAGRIRGFVVNFARRLLRRQTKLNRAGPQSQENISDYY